MSVNYAEVTSRGLKVKSYYYCIYFIAVYVYTWVNAISVFKLTAFQSLPTSFNMSSQQQSLQADHSQRTCVNLYYSVLHPVARNIKL
jgi:hypothetical protein